MAEAREELVSIIVAGFNAAGTIDATLHSLRSQSHRKLEIIVVDDGSSDGTAAVVEGHARADQRVRLLRQDNGGAGAARNAGVRSASSEFIAICDADDLRAPDSISLQLAVLRESGESTALVYNWSAEIDDGGIVRNHGEPWHIAGKVVEPICRHNFIDNGSSIMIRKSAFQEVGGYDAALTGCADWDLSIRLAERYEFALVPAYLTGYRVGAPSMASGAQGFVRNMLYIRERLLERRPELRGAIQQGIERAFAWKLRRVVQTGNPAAIASILSAGRTLLSLPALARLIAWEAGWKATPRALRPSIRKLVFRARAARVEQVDAPRIGERFPVGKLPSQR